MMVYDADVAKRVHAYIQCMNLEQDIVGRDVHLTCERRTLIAAIVAMVSCRDYGFRHLCFVPSARKGSIVSAKGIARLWTVAQKVLLYSSERGRLRPSAEAGPLEVTTL